MVDRVQTNPGTEDKTSKANVAGGDPLRLTPVPDSVRREVSRERTAAAAGTSVNPQEQLKLLVEQGLVSDVAYRVLIGKRHSNNTNTTRLDARISDSDLADVISIVDKLKDKNVGGIREKLDYALAAGGVASIRQLEGKGWFTEVVNSVARFNVGGLLQGTLNWLQGKKAPWEEKLNFPQVNESTPESSRASERTLSVSRSTIDKDKLNKIIKRYSGGRDAPLDADEFIYIADKYDIDIRLLISMAVMESNIGTNGKRTLSTKNMFNYGNDDAGNNKSFGSWLEGAEYYASRLGKYYGQTLADVQRTSFAHKDGIGFYCAAYNGMTGATAAREYTKAVVKLGNEIGRELGLS